jgi:hypothetical protein
MSCPYRDSNPRRPVRGLVAIPTTLSRLPIIIIIIIKELGVTLDNENWYVHIARLVETSHEGKVAILWNQQVQTDRIIPKKKPDIIICDNGKGTCML